jgi:hypothetical protein
MSLTQTQHCGYCVHQAAVTKMNNVFHVCGEKKTTQPAEEKHYRLVIYTQNATGNLPCNFKIYWILFCPRNHKQIRRKIKLCKIIAISGNGL